VFYPSSQSSNVVLVNLESLAETDGERRPDLELFKQLVLFALPVWQALRQYDVISLLDG
jgi:hypothetical protein